MEEINKSAFAQKMKTLKFIGIAFAAMLLCLNFTACGGDDDEDGGGSGTQTTTDSFGVITGEKKLTKATEELDNGWSESYTFTYDNNGRLTKVVRIVNDGSSSKPHTYTYTYKWNETDKSITIYSDYEDNNNELDFKGYIKDGKFEKAIDYSLDEESSIITYKNGRLSTFDVIENENGKETYRSLGVFVWNNDKLTETYNQLYDDEKCSYTYSGKTCKGYYPYIIDYSHDNLVGAFREGGAEYLIWAHPELLGLRTSQLPESMFNIEEYNENRNTYYKPTFYEDGYLEKMTTVSTWSDGSSSDSYTFTWE